MPKSKDKEPDPGVTMYIRRSDREYIRRMRTIDGRGTDIEQLHQMLKQYKRWIRGPKSRKGARP